MLEKLNDDQKNLIFFSLSAGRLSEANRMFRDLTEAPVRPAPRPAPQKKKSKAYSLAVEQQASFTQSIEIGGRKFARNPYTGEITTPHDAESLENNIKALSAQLELEEAKKETEELARSEALARRLQQEFDSGREPSAEDETTCQICLVGIQDKDLLPLDACGHIFHPDCIKEHLQVSITESRFPILCPIRGCGVEVSILDIKERLSEEMADKFEEFSFQHFVGLNKSSLFSCPTPDCKYVFQFACEEEFTCPVCSKHFCLKCQVEFHDGMTCEQYRKVNQHSEADDQFLLMVQGARFKQCPNCKFWVEKTEGCDHMRCRCQYEFCYACGGKYGDCPCVRQRVPVPRMRMRQAPMRRRAPMKKAGFRKVGAKK